MTKPPVPPPTAPAAASEARQVLLGVLAGHLFAAAARRPPRTLRIGAAIAGEAGARLDTDLVVAGGPAVSGRTTVAEPLVIVHLLGPDTEETVRKIKLPAFRAQPSCREVVLVQEHRLYCEIHRRLAGDRWITDLLLDRDGRLRLDTGGIDLTLSALYGQTGVGRA